MSRSDLAAPAPTTVVEAAQPRPDGPLARVRAWLADRPGLIRDAAVWLAMTAGSLLVFADLWAGVGDRVLHGNVDDQMLFEWMFTHAANSVTGLDNPFLAPEMGTPTTANLMGNTSVLLLAIPLTPVTLVFGAAVSFALSVTASLAGTAIAWYAFMRRHLDVSRIAAAAGAVFCGFSPGMVSQATGHPHIAAQFLVPAMITLTLRLGQPGRTRRTGVLLGLTVAAQVFLGEEVLFVTVLVLGVFTACYAVQRWSEVRPRVRGALVSFAIAAPVALIFTGYPLYLQFLSPYAYHTIPNGIYTADLSAYVSYATNSLGFSGRVSAANASEETAFFGWPLLTVAGIAALWLWRVVWLRTVVLTGAVFLAASLGPEVRWRGEKTGVPGPWRLLSEAPIFHDIITVRFALVLTPVIGLLIAMSWQAATRPNPVGRWRAGLRYAWPAALAAAVLPTLPGILDAAPPRQPIPAFITEGGWRTCVDPGGTLAAYPVGVGRMGKTQMRWQNAAGLGFAIPNGYYISRAADGKGQWGQPSRATDLLVYRVIDTGQVQPVPPELRVQVHADLAYWRAQCVAVEADRPQIEALKTTLTSAIGALPQNAGGVWYWGLR